MGYRILADGVVILHLFFILFVIFGGLLVLRRTRLLWAHLPAVVWGALIEFVGWICPLTPLENWLRFQGGEAGYTGGFVEHYIIPVIYPDGLTRGIQIGLGIMVLVINLAVYGIFLRRIIHLKKRK